MRVFRQSHNEVNNFSNYRHLGKPIYLDSSALPGTLDYLVIPFLIMTVYGAIEKQRIQGLANLLD